MNLIKGAIIFILGAAAGSAVTYKIVKDKYRKIADEEIEEMREVSRRKIREFEHKLSEKDAQAEEQEEEIELYRTVIREQGYNVYSNIADLNFSYIKKDEDHPEDDDEHAELSVTAKHPIFITADQYGEGAPGHEGIEVSYFATDRVFANAETSEMLGDEVFHPLTNDIIKSFITDPSQTIYVRDYSIGADYLIECYSGSYHEIILGDDEMEGNVYDNDTDYD